jgi:hypothetical protein
MQIVVLKLAKPGYHWEMGNLSVCPKNPETQPFDLDAIDIRMQRSIIRASEVFGVIEILDYSGPPEITVPLPKDALSIGPVKFEEITIPNCEVFSEPKPISVIKEQKITEEDRKNAKIILSKTIKIIKEIVSGYIPNSENRMFILCLLQEEQKGKNRKTITTILEKTFLAIPPEGE